MLCYEDYVFMFQRLVSKLLTFSIPTRYHSFGQVTQTHFSAQLSHAMNTNKLELAYLFVAPLNIHLKFIIEHKVHSIGTGAFIFMNEVHQFHIFFILLTYLKSLRFFNCRLTWDCP